MSDYRQKSGEIDWADFQKKYFDALMSFNPGQSSFNKHNPLENSFFNSAFFNNRNPMENSFLNSAIFNNRNPIESSLWNSAMEHWWKSMKMKSGSSFENENLFEKVIDQCRNYYFMSEQFSNLIEGISKFNNQKEDVTDFINNKFEELQGMFAKAPDKLNWSKFIDEINWAEFQKKYFDAYETHFETLNDNLSGNMFDFSSMFEGINPELKKVRNQILSIPNVGQNREIQDKFQKLIKLGAIYQDYNNEHQSVMAGLSQKALELMRTEILRMSEKGEELSSMRQIYDLWVESNEKIYSDHVHTKEYSELNGKLVNSQMAFMKLSHEVNEDILTAMNLPTTRAMNELERRHYELRKKVRVLESELQTLKAKSGRKVTVEEAKPAVVQEKTVSAASTVMKKKKTARKKVAKKKAEKKVANSVKKKTVRRAAKSLKKKDKARRRSNLVNNDVIEIKF